MSIWGRNTTYKTNGCPLAEPHIAAVALFGALLTLILLCLPGHAKSPQGKKNTGYVFDQRSEQAGRLETVVSAKGVRIKIKNLTAVVTAPKFDAVLFDSGTRKYTELPYDVWWERYKLKSKSEAVPTAKKAKIAGLNARMSKVPTKKSTKEVWFTNDLSVPSSMCSFVCSVMHLPVGQGMPVRMDLAKVNGVRERAFDTLKLTKLDNVEAKTFEIPKGFKKVDSEYQLFVKDDTAKDMGSFLE